MDYENLRQDYPETISMEQFYKIAHISKRKAKWLLENGIIPCEDSGKQTRRFRLYLADAIEFLRQREMGSWLGLFLWAVLPTAARGRYRRRSI